MSTKFVFVTGGVVSGLGKGICAASLGRLLKQRGVRVRNQKFDPYINVDPGTMSPYQHGEVFVTDDGAETDLDLGHYERFVDEDLGGNSYSLSWNETKGGGYEVQQLVGDTWETLSSVERDGERVYLTGMLPSCREQTFRVVTVGGAIPEGAEYAAEPAEVNFRTELSSLYCTIWPLTELTLYKEADSASESLGTIPAGSTLCVLGEEDGLFRVRYDGRYGYIDSRYCLINLPEYLGDLISYNITNSYASLYAVHGYEIPEVTGTVIVGYEHVRLAEGVYLAPYLYPCCEKLYTAANSAIEQGYRLKIYDSYRPNRATRDIYDKAEALANRNTGTDLEDACDALDLVRGRAGLAPTTAGTQEEVLAAVRLERRRELGFESHRFFDLMRWGREIAVEALGPDIASVWTGDRFYFPIPQSELDSNKGIEQ